MRNQIITICSVALLALGACTEEENNGTNNGTTAGTNNTSNGTTGETTNNGTTNGGTTGGTTNNGTTNNATTGGTTAGTTGAADSTMCLAYCEKAITTCVGANELYASVEMCLTACEGLVDTDTDCSADATTCDTGGDSVQCRLYHVNAAAADADTHCGHAAVLSAGDVCTDK